MAHEANGASVVGPRDQARPFDDSERVYLESLVRSDYERCHPDETLEDLKHRACFTKEDKGLLRDWMALAARRASARRNDDIASGMRISASACHSVGIAAGLQAPHWSVSCD